MNNHQSWRLKRKPPHPQPKRLSANISGFLPSHVLTHKYVCTLTQISFPKLLLSTLHPLISIQNVTSIKIFEIYPKCCFYQNIDFTFLIFMILSNTLTLLFSFPCWSSSLKRWSYFFIFMLNTFLKTSTLLFSSLFQ
jgi:hypothetical protein